jgi:RHS repeat-associated protein
MAELKFVSGFVSTYRYGFNGKEKDDEVSGGGNDYDYGARIYNPRLGRFLSIDPLASDYPFYSPYLFAGNKPIMAVDIDGLEADKNPNVVEVPLEGINKRIDLKVVSTSSGLTGMEKFKAFGIGVLKGVTAAVVVVAVAAAVVATCGVAGVVLVEAAAVVGATYMAKEATEVITGKSMSTGEKLTQGERYDKAGQIAGGLIVGGIANKIGQGVGKLISGITKTPPIEGTPTEISAEVSDKDLVGFRRDHIINRHASGAGKPNKTEFPDTWSNDKIITEVNKIANDPQAPGGTGAYDAPYKTGTVEGIEIRVDFYPSNSKYAGNVSTAYPTNTTPNPPKK